MKIQQGGGVHLKWEKRGRSKEDDRTRNAQRKSKKKRKNPAKENRKPTFTQEPEEILSRRGRRGRGVRKIRRRGIIQRRAVTDQTVRPKKDEG